jgi:phosphatidylglycerophosphate synthase
MNKDTARKIADALTWSRIWSAVPITLLAWYELKWWVFALYVAAALTDLLDGMFARRASPPAKDIDFDGLADLLLSVMTLLWLWLLIPGFFPKYWFPYLPVLVVLELYMSLVRIRRPDLAIPHFQFGRFAMALFFILLPVLIVWNDVPWFVHLVFIVGTAGKVQLTWAIVRLVGREPASEPNT